MSSVQVTGVTQYSGRFCLFEGLDLEVKPAIFGLLGSNGAGKTTLLRILATVLWPDGGSLRLLVSDPQDQESCRVLRRQLGYLSQSFGYYRNFTVRESVEDMSLLKEVPPRGAGRLVDEPSQ